MELTPEQVQAIEVLKEAVIEFMEKVNEIWNEVIVPFFEALFKSDLYKAIVEYANAAYKLQVEKNKLLGVSE